VRAVNLASVHELIMNIENILGSSWTLRWNFSLNPANIANPTQRAEQKPPPAHLFLSSATPIPPTNSFHYPPCGRPATDHGANES
jgi:hypothetical protein